MIRAKSYYFKWTKLRVGMSLVHDKEWDDVACRDIIGHRWVQKSVQLAALWRQVAPPAFSEHGTSPKDLK